MTFASIIRLLLRFPCAVHLASGAPQLNEGCFFQLNRQGYMTPANRALKPPPVAAPFKSSVYDCAAFRALCIGVPIAVVIFRYELSFRHKAVR